MIAVNNKNNTRNFDRRKMETFRMACKCVVDISD